MREYLSLQEIVGDFEEWGIGFSDLMEMDLHMPSENPFPLNVQNVDVDTYVEDPENSEDDDFEADIPEPFVENNIHEKRSPAAHEGGAHLTDDQAAKLRLDQHVNERLSKWVRLLEVDLGLGDPTSPNFRPPQKRPASLAEERRTMTALQLLDPEIFADQSADSEVSNWSRGELDEMIANLTGRMRAQLDGWREARLFEGGAYGGAGGIVAIPFLGGFVEEKKIWEGWNLWVKEIMELLKEKLQGLVVWRYGKIAEKV